MEFDAYLRHIATHFAHELEPIMQVKEVTRNSDLLGAFAEAAVRRLVSRIVSPMRVCTGGIIDYPMPERIRQVDVIIWAPFPAPALYDVEGFGLVPRGSAWGVMEIKRTNYSSAEPSIASFLEDVAATRLTADRHQNVAADHVQRLGVVVIPILDSVPSARLSGWLDTGEALAIFERDGDNLRVRTEDVLRLINFLHAISWRYHMHAALPGYPQVHTNADRIMR